MTLLYFAWVRQKVGAGEETMNLPPGVATVDDLIRYLQKRGGGYSDVFAEPSRLRVAVNQQHAGFDASISANDEIAFFPPVTGG